MRYLLTFKPLKNFFFGNDKTFSEDYLAISEYFPQNTQLLGAIRLYIAEQHRLMHIHKNGKYSNNPNELKKLIGTASSKDFDTDTDLGKIQNLSQMFVASHDLSDAFFSTPFDIEIGERSIQYYQLANIDNDYFLSNYDAKKASSQKLANGNFWQNYIDKKELSVNDIKEFDQVFIAHHQVGIGLENKQTIEGAFYSKTDYQLRDDFVFACLMEIEEQIIHDGIIQLGAESSLFELTITKLEDTKLAHHPIVSKLFAVPLAGDKVVALSEVMLESTNEFHAYFSIVPFYKNFAMLDYTQAHYYGKTPQKRLIPMGTVSYIKEQVMPTNPNLGAYAKMGYNQFITTKN